MPFSVDLAASVGSVTRNNLCDFVLIFFLFVDGFGILFDNFLYNLFPRSVDFLKIIFLCRTFLPHEKIQTIRATIVRDLLVGSLVEEV